MTTDFRIHLVTWNVGETDPIQNFTELLDLDSPQPPNLYGIGLQELKSTTAQIVSSAVFDDAWTVAFTDCLAARNYVRVKSLRLVGMLIAIFIRRSDLPYVGNIEALFTRTGFGGYWGNKGTVSIRLDLFGVNLCLINSHFQAHPENFAARIEDYNMTIQGQRFKSKDTPSILDHDYVFWIGDLNFRIDELSNAEVRRKISIRDFESLKKHDQLLIAREKQLIFVDFEEEPISFAPTFKFDTGTDNYDSSSKNRVPSWCDRILYLVHEDAYEGADMSVRPLVYKSISSYQTSDHKPVVAQFIIQVLRNPPELPVMFYPLGCWCQSSDGKVSYVVNSTFPVQSRDWIGLYREGYKHMNDYVTYTWAGSKSEDMQDGSVLYNVRFDSSYLQKLPTGYYYLCYYSAALDCIMGYSNRLTLTSTEESSESSDDSGCDDVDGDVHQISAADRTTNHLLLNSIQQMSLAENCDRLNSPTHQGRQLKTDDAVETVKQQMETATESGAVLSNIDAEENDVQNNTDIQQRESAAVCSGIQSSQEEAEELKDEDATAVTLSDTGCNIQNDNTHVKHMEASGGGCHNNEANIQQMEAARRLDNVELNTHQIEEAAGRHNGKVISQVEAAASAENASCRDKIAAAEQLQSQAMEQQLAAVDQQLHNKQ